MANTYTQTLGRRKQATAQVRLHPGKGGITVNNKEYKAYFTTDILQQKITDPLKKTGTEDQYDITVRVEGGGITGQAESIRLGISRALIEIQPDYRPVLKKEGYLTRDPRERERKKYGKKSARRSPQWAKR